MAGDVGDVEVVAFPASTTSWDDAYVQVDDVWEAPSDSPK